MSEDSEIRTFIESEMKSRMDVFTTVGSTTSRYDQPAGDDIPCMIVRINPNGAITVSDRTQLSQLRVLTFPLSFSMPKRARVVVGGKTWQVVADSIQEQVGPTGVPVANTCDLVSADRSST